ncbi:MAG: glycosyltransferase family 4 protein [Actinomycetaceae bacterium]|nr:glycosyltransferase family 4 protein [Actinomycetaceae bacterium]
MRILYVVGKSNGGLGSQVDDLQQRMRKSGHDVRILTDGMTAKHFGWDGVDLLWPLIPRSLHAFRQVIRRLREAKKLFASADLIHAHGHQAGLLVALLLPPRRRGPRFVVSIHNPVRADLPRNLLRTLRIHTARRADVVTGTSSDLVRQAHEDGARCVRLSPIPSHKLADFLAEPLTSRDYRRQAWEDLCTSEHIENKGPLVLSLGRVEERKRLDVLIQAAALVQSPATFVVVGPGNPAFIARLRSMSSTVRVHLVGPRTDVKPWLAAASVFAISSDWEPGSLVVQEAMAAGVPVVATSAGGLIDLLDSHGQSPETGVLIPRDNPQALAKAIDSMLIDTPMWYTYQQRARLRVQEWQTPGELAVTWGSWYAQLLESGTLTEEGPEV